MMHLLLGLLRADQRIVLARFADWTDAFCAFGSLMFCHQTDWANAPFFQVGHLLVQRKRPELVAVPEVMMDIGATCWTLWHWGL